MVPGTVSCGFCVNGGPSALVAISNSSGFHKHPSKSKITSRGSFVDLVDDFDDVLDPDGLFFFRLALADSRSGLSPGFMESLFDHCVTSLRDNKLKHQATALSCISIWQCIDGAMLMAVLDDDNERLSK